MAKEAYDETDNCTETGKPLKGTDWPESGGKPGFGAQGGEVRGDAKRGQSGKFPLTPRK